MEDEYFEHIKKIKDKLESDPDLKKEVDLYIERICEIFETPVELNVLFYPKIEEYKSVLTNYVEKETSKDIIDLDEFLEQLNKEDKKLKLSIDPIHLNEGINDIVNFLITTINNKIIIVPINENYEKEKKDNRN